VSDLPGWTPSESERSGRGPTARQAFGALGCGVAAGFFMGALVGGFAGERIIGVVIGAPLFLLAGLGFTMKIGQRVRVGILPRIALFVAALAAGFRIAQALSHEVAGPPPQDLGKAVSSPEGISGLILLGVAVVVALYLSLTRFPLVSETSPPAEGAAS